jgi:site-specific DNA recombinase
MEKILGIYVRVSTIHQVDGVSVDSQIRKGIECHTKNGYTNYEIFQELPKSGELSLKDRPQLKRLFDKIENGTIHGVSIYSIARLSRGDDSLNNLLKSTIIKSGAELFEDGNKINLKDLGEELMVDFKFLMSRFERNTTKKRVKDNMKQIVLNGRIFGGPMLPFGYKKGENKELLIDENESVIVKKIYQYCIKGFGTKVISNKLNDEKIPTKRNSVSKGYMKVKGQRKTNFLWRDSVVYRILTNPIYKGKRTFKGEQLDTPKTMIVESSVFDKVQEILKKRKHNVNTKKKYVYQLKGLLKCQKCGNRLYGRKREDLSDNQYICSSQRHKNEFCGLRGLNIDFWDNFVWKTIFQLPKGVEECLTKLSEKENLQKQKDDILELEKEIIELKNKRESLIDTLSNPELKTKSTIIKRLNEIELNIELVEERRRSRKKMISYMNDKKVIIDHIKNIVNEIKSKKSTTELEKQMIFQTLINRIVVDWDSNKLCHVVLIEYSIDKLTNFLLTNESVVDYKKWGYSFRKIKIEDNFNIYRVLKLEGEKLIDEEFKIQLEDNKIKLISKILSSKLKK